MHFMNEFQENKSLDTWISCFYDPNLNSSPPQEIP